MSTVSLQKRKKTGRWTPGKTIGGKGSTRTLSIAEKKMDNTVLRRAKERAGLKRVHDPARREMDANRSFSTPRMRGEGSLAKKEVGVIEVY